MAQFRDFLSTNNYPESLVWVWPENILLSGRRRYYVYVRDASVTEARAREFFAANRDRGLGIRFATICADKNTTYANSCSPADRDEALRSLMGNGLKLSAQTNRVDATRVRNAVWWKVLARVYRARQEFREDVFQ